MSELADEADSKSVGGNTAWVQVPLRSKKKNQTFITKQKTKMIDYWGVKQAPRLVGKAFSSNHL